MAWEWSYSAEGEQNIHDQIHAQNREWLEVCWAECESAIPRQHGEYEFDEAGFGEKLTEAGTKERTDEQLADVIWKHAQKIRTSDNGAHNAYCCPHGCHMVPVTPVEKAKSALKRISVFKLTRDDWYPSFQLSTRATGRTGRQIVELLRLELPDGDWRVLARGGDDYGLERDFSGEDAEAQATTIFEGLLDWEFINQKELAALGFVHM